VKEKDATSGQKLCAVFIACQLGVTFKTALDRYIYSDSHHSWEQLYAAIARQSADGVLKGEDSN